VIWRCIKQNPEGDRDAVNQIEPHFETDDQKMNIQKTNIREDNQESVVRRFVQDAILSPEIKAIPDRQTA